MWNSLRIKLTIIFLGLAIGPLLLVGVILAQRSFNFEREQALDLQGQVARRLSAEVESFVLEVDNDLNLLRGEIRNADQPDRAQQLSLLLDKFNSGPYRDVYEELILLDSEGYEQLRHSRRDIVSSDRPLDWSRTAEYEQPKATRQTYFGPVRFDEKTGESYMSIALPLTELRSVQLSGVIIAEVRFAAVERLLAQANVGENQTIYMVDVENRVIAHQNPSSGLHGTSIEVPEVPSTQTGLGGTDVVLAADDIQLGDSIFTVVAEKPLSEALQVSSSITNTLVVTTAVALAIAITLGFLVIRKIVRPIENLAASAKAVSTGDLSQRVEVTSRDELGALARAFNFMTERLGNLVEHLEERISERTRALETSAEISYQLATILDLDELLKFVVDRLQN